MQGPTAPGETPQITHLSDGEQAVFGTCGCRRCRFDIRLAPASPQGYAGRITAVDEHWRLDNLSGRHELLVENIDRPHEYLSVAPGVGGIPIPFEISRVYARGTGSDLGVTVFGMESSLASPIEARCLTPEETGPLLNPASTHYQVLAALCAPRLHGAPDSPLPSAAQIARTLTAAGNRLSERAVVAHIDYLVTRLGLRRPERAGRAWKRELLVATSLRDGLLDEATMINFPGAGHQTTAD
ncbi:hypothetical protein AB0M02_02760 [Actinoplanes sp. NPDC051861]|uniref:hypothetical protein n=1 Tax=Actinoplanes sp. NPDC051861 TaxID=3155170 RepID=UPI003434F1A6